MNDDELTSPAHTRAQTVRELAEARAKARVADTEARLQVLIEEGGRRFQESARPPASRIHS